MSAENVYKQRKICQDLKQYTQEQAFQDGLIEYI